MFSACEFVADAQPGVRRAVGGAGLQGGTGLPHLRPGEECGGAEGGLQEPHAAPVQHTLHAELLHPPPPQGEGGRNTAGQSDGGEIEAAHCCPEFSASISVNGKSVNYLKGRADLFLCNFNPEVFKAVYKFVLAV